jgi:predicted RNase H-like HicB family nuclease
MLLSLRPYTVDMTFRVVLEFDPEAGSYSAVCPELPGCASAGDNEEQARANIREAIELYLAPVEIDPAENVKPITFAGDISAR